MIIIGIYYNISTATCNFVLSSCAYQIRGGCECVRERGSASLRLKAFNQKIRLGRNEHVFRSQLNENEEEDA